MLLGFVVEDEGDLNLIVLRDGQIVLDDERLPDLNNLLEESFGVDKLSRLLE